jgi:hypothetical protein
MQGGSTKNNTDSKPKYLGSKMSDGQIAFPGQIIMRQRGMRFKAGEGVGMVSQRPGPQLPLAPCRPRSYCVRRWAHAPGLRVPPWRAVVRSDHPLKPSLALA